MPTLKITGWKPGFQTISVTRILNDKLGIGLKNAKLRTEDVIDDKEVFFDMRNIVEATALRDELVELGAIAEVIED